MKITRQVKANRVLLNEKTQEAIVKFEKKEDLPFTMPCTLHYTPTVLGGGGTVSALSTNAYILDHEILINLSKGAYIRLGLKKAKGLKLVLGSIEKKQKFRIGMYELKEIACIDDPKLERFYEVSNDINNDIYTLPKTLIDSLVLLAQKLGSL